MSKPVAHIMLAFVSPVNERYLQTPIVYDDISGVPYTAVQTNESAIVWLMRHLADNPPENIFLIASELVRCGKIPHTEKYGDVTHLEFLQKRLIQEFPLLKERFTVHKYATFGNSPADLENNLREVADIADAVAAFANKCTADSIVVHADMTGGFRHASMLMLSIMQLLKYRGLAIGEVLYSDPQGPVVYRATEIQRMFSLIAGADEFVKFGSVTALEEYFAGKKSGALAELLLAMRRFSDAVKVCRTSALEKELQNLSRCLKLFRDNPDKDLKSVIFAKITDTIEKEYGVLLTDNVTRPDIIRWCVKKGFWQQALTLCTEWLPEEIIKCGICLPGNELVRRDAAIKAAMGRNWQQHLIINYAESSMENLEKTALNEFCHKLRGVMRLPYSSDNTFAPSLNKFMTQYESGKTYFRRYRSGQLSMNDIKTKFGTLWHAWEILFDIRTQNSWVGHRKEKSYRVAIGNFLQKYNYDNLIRDVANLPSDLLLDALGIDKQEIMQQYRPQIPDNEAETGRKKDWQTRAADYEKLLDNGILRTEVKRSVAMDILHGYYDIRNERNKINHASEHGSTGTNELAAMIEGYLQKLSLAKK